MERHLGRARGRLALGATVALVIAATASSAVVAQDERPYEGVTLNVSTYSASPEFDFYGTLIPEFEEATGIDVNYVQQPIEAQDTKIPLQHRPVPRTRRQPNHKRSHPASSTPSACRHERQR